MMEGHLPTFALTVDVEEYFHATIFHDVIPRKEWEERAGRVASSVDRLLERFDEWGVHATFFVLGWVAERQPAMIRRIAGAGHEVGSHGQTHELIYNQTPDVFREEIRRARSTLEDLAGAPVRGFRAPTFSITERSLWALPILAEEGFHYDSSIFPIHHDRYGIPRFPRFPVRLDWGGRSLVEVPLSTWKIGPWSLPVSGGGYLRHLPLSWICRGLERVRREGGVPVLYVHPWEIDVSQPRVSLSWARRFRHYRSIHRVEGLLAELIRSAPYGPLGEVLAGHDPAPYSTDRLS